MGAVSTGRVGRRAHRGRRSEFGAVELGDAGEEGVAHTSAESQIDGSTPEQRCSKFANLFTIHSFPTPSA